MSMPLDVAVEIAGAVANCAVSRLPLIMPTAAAEIVASPIRRLLLSGSRGGAGRGAEFRSIANSRTRIAAAMAYLHEHDILWYAGHNKPYDTA